MGQRVKARATYMPEVARIGRLREAILLDDRQSQEWRKQLDDHLKAAIALLASAETVSNGG